MKQELKAKLGEAQTFMDGPFHEMITVIVIIHLNLMKLVSILICVSYLICTGAQRACNFPSEHVIVAACTSMGGSSSIYGSSLFVL